MTEPSLPERKEASPRKPIDYIYPFECEYIYFKIIDLKPKTDVYGVFTKSHDKIIGWVKWFPQWRQYCFFPIADTVYSCGCLGDLTLFLQELKKGVAP